MEIAELYKIYKSNPNICTDSRKIQKGSIFFALKGENFDGNKFAEKAINCGCDLAIIDNEKFSTNPKTLLVDNVLKTLQDLARYHRKQISIPIIGITGTNGKTTSKELIYTVLSSTKNCYATKGNLNNHIGVPLSILEINNTHDIAIIEMGANHKKEIGFLCDITRPTHGIITNIGFAHLEGFKSLQGVIDTKNELYIFIKENNGKLFVNNDDDLLIKLSNNIKRITYGSKSTLNMSISSNTPFLNIIWESRIVKSRLIGEYQFYNIALAICIGEYFNIPKNKTQAAIESYIPQNNRSEITETESNKIIMDAYNANPSSMMAMLYSFANQSYKNKLCILGDMLELGDFANKEHAKIIKTCKKLKLEAIFVGKEFRKVTKKTFIKLTDLENFLKEKPIKNKTILLKGSRGIGLEKIIKSL